MEAGGEQPELEPEPEPESDSDPVSDVVEAASSEPETAPARPRRARRKPAEAKPGADGAEEDQEAKPKQARGRRRKPAEKEPAMAAEPAPSDDGNGSSIAVEPVEIVVPVSDIPAPEQVAETVAAEAESPKGPARKGWWNRLTS